MQLSYWFTSIYRALYQRYIIFAKAFKALIGMYFNGYKNLLQHIL